MEMNADNSLMISVVVVVVHKQTQISRAGCNVFSVIGKWNEFVIDVLGDPQESVPELGCNGNLSRVEGGSNLEIRRISIMMNRPKFKNVFFSR